ncbi:hypothetical protein ADH76_34640 [Enterocloster clostridioformis]|uniref:hypothetical protein n=1 Tax=Enterocloster clostridioformis TaxID=1531 RepID=UPI00080C8458|nr:hypothetical protein [Enterocloster clostridioformis]ANU45546.1 hypothetical protein A4V08_06630 [Lachnoclostridium sp. YL32]NDO27314.1 hypothetical protein [Enterocloster clostridioformis]OXE61602.1 hypothetical protein ADH76_34640 [Enterocloster clostridioformis]
MRFGAYEQIVDWIKDSKEWLDAQYFNKTVKGQWNDDWNKTMGSESKVFAFSGGRLNILHVITRKIIEWV